jgi:hypothetical protein
MNCANQPCLVGVIVNGSKLDIDLLCFENYGNSSGDYLADPTRSESSPDGNSRSILPLLQLKKALNDESEVLRKILNCTVNQAPASRKSSIVTPTSRSPDRSTEPASSSILVG